MALSSHSGTALFRRMKNNCIYLGIEIGGTKLQIVVGDSRGNISQRNRFQVNPSKGGEGIRRQIKTAFSKWARTARLEAVGIGFGGPVDWRTGRVSCSHQ